METKNPISNVISTMIYVAGSIALFVAVCAVISKFLPYISGCINKSMVKHSNSKIDEDDWGPVIEKKK